MFVTFSIKWWTRLFSPKKTQVLKILLSNISSVGKTLRNPLSLFSTILPSSSSSPPPPARPGPPLYAKPTKSRSRLCLFEKPIKCFYFLSFFCWCCSVHFLHAYSFLLFSFVCFCSCVIVSGASENRCIRKTKIDKWLVKGAPSQLKHTRSYKFNWRRWLISPYYIVVFWGASHVLCLVRFWILPSSPTLIFSMYTFMLFLTVLEENCTKKNKRPLDRTETVMVKQQACHTQSKYICFTSPWQHQNGLKT